MVGWNCPRPQTNSQLRCFGKCLPVYLQYLARNNLPPNVCCWWGEFTEGPYHRRRIKTEEKTKVVASVWGEEFIQFLAVLAVGRFLIIGWIAPGWFERKGLIHPFLQIVLKQNSSKEFNKFFPPNGNDDLWLFICLYPSSMICYHWA